MPYEITQGILGDETETRVYNVTQVPENILLSNVRLPQTLAFQTKPLKGSTVMVASADAYKSYIIAVIREPLSFVGENAFVRGFEKGFIQPGEIFCESRGDPESPIPGTGASLFLGNSGSAFLCSGKRKEFLTIGGAIDDSDGEVILQGDNGYFKSNVNHITSMQSSVDFDNFQNLHIGNSIVTPGATDFTTVVMNELTMDTLGNIELRNATAGVTNTSLNMDSLGNVTLENTLGSVTIDLAGNVIIKNNTGSMKVNVAGQVILNNGTLGVARLTDTTLSNISTDPAFWTWWLLLPSLISALPTTPLDGGATLKAGLATLFGTYPTMQTARISGASATVRAG